MKREVGGDRRRRHAEAHPEVGERDHLAAHVEHARNIGLRARHPRHRDGIENFAHLSGVEREHLAGEAEHEHLTGRFLGAGHQANSGVDDLIRASRA